MPEKQEAGRDFYNVGRDLIIQEEAQKSREIELIEKKLERFYLPIQNVLSSVLIEEDYNEQQYIIDKAYALNDVFKEVKNFSYLASPKLRKLIKRLPYLIHCFNEPSVVTMDTSDAWNEINASIPTIERLIVDDIKKYQQKLDEITF